MTTSRPETLSQAASAILSKDDPRCVDVIDPLIACGKFGIWLGRSGCKGHSR